VFYIACLNNYMFWPPSGCILSYFKANYKIYSVFVFIKEISFTSMKHTFHPRVINNTNITFSNSETTLLEKGLKYNLHTKMKNWLLNLALEAETDITQLPITDCEFYRKPIADHIETLQHFKVSRLFTQKINQLTPLPYSFHIKNTTEHIQNLKETPILPYFTFASLDITNLLTYLLHGAESFLRS